MSEPKPIELKGATAHAPRRQQYGKTHNGPCPSGKGLAKRLKKAAARRYK